jgi:hypothetical protein
MLSIAVEGFEEIGKCISHLETRKPSLDTTLVQELSILKTCAIDNMDVFMAQRQPHGN